MMFESDYVGFWSIVPEESTSILLWRIDPSKFRIMRRGSFSTVLTNADYILLDRKFSQIIAKVLDQARVKNVTIIDLKNNETSDEYFEIQIANEITPENYESSKKDGLRIWRYGSESWFVSDQLRESLENVPNHGLRFEPGFYWFAGEET